MQESVLTQQWRGPVIWLKTLEHYLVTSHRKYKDPLAL